MKRDGHGVPRALVMLVLAGLALTLMQKEAFADKKPKSYPESGKVIGRGTTGHTRGNGTAYSQTYKVETDKAVFLLDCGKLPFMGGTGGECGGEKKIQIGDVLHFRIDKNYVYIPVADLSGATGSDEEKLRIISQELRPDAPAEKTTGPQL
jgi:hypothetical protein